MVSCITEGVQTQFKKASLVNHYFSGVDLHLLKNEDFENETISKMYSDILSKCNHTCPDNDCTCVSTYTTTIGTRYVFPGIRVDLPDRPSFNIVYGEKVSFLDTFNFVCSCVGVWLGFSFADINPFKNRKKRNKKIAPNHEDNHRDLKINENRCLIDTLLHRIQSLENEMKQSRINQVRNQTKVV